MAATEDRFAGCLIGQGVGDALGFMVEGFPAQVCGPYADAVLYRHRYDGHYRGHFRLGQYSDDTQLARELAQSMVARRGFDAADFARRIAALFADGRVVGGGRATAAAAARLAAGVPWTESGTPAPNAGNGSAMRAAPVGLLFHGDDDRLVAAACDQGRCTHADPRCSAGAVAVAGAVALAMTMPRIAPVPFLGELAALAEPVEASVAAALRALADAVDLAPTEALARVVEIGRPDYRDVPEGVSPFVTTSVCWSLYSFLRSPDDYVATIHTAVAVGGDVDTTAAMAGAMAGARCGLAAVPRDLANRLTDRGHWGAGRLVALARSLWRLAAER